MMAAASPYVISMQTNCGQAQTGFCQHAPAPSTTLVPNHKAKAVKIVMVSFYQVPLVSPAAPEIGCGSGSKPLLLELESTNAVSGAWLNRAGTIMADVWANQSTAKQRAGIIKTLPRRQPTFTELARSAKQQALKDFRDGNGWYRGAGVDRLSEEETGIIAARLVQPVQEKTALPQEKAGALQRAFMEAPRKRFTDNKAKRKQNAPLKSGHGLQQAVGEYLDKDQIPVLKEAIESGLCPLPGER